MHAGWVFFPRSRGNRGPRLRRSPACGEGQEQVSPGRAGGSARRTAWW